MFPAFALLAVSKLDDYVFMAMRASVYIIGAVILSVLVRLFFGWVRNKSIEMVRSRGRAGADVEFEKQTRTVTSIARKLIIGLIWLLAAILALKEFNFDIAPLLASLGVAGIAIGFAAQNVLKDWLNGFFLLAEGQIRINDVVRIGDLTGKVEHLSLRTVTLRGIDGAVHVISNGSITQFSNLTLGHAYALFDIPARYEDNPGRMMQLMRDTADSLRADPEYRSLILEPLEMLGVDRFVESGVYVKARLKTKPDEQWKVGREFLRRLKSEADRGGVQIATARRSVHVADAPAEIAEAAERRTMP